MRFLLESSWTRFGPAGRDSLDWNPGSSALPSTDGQSPGQRSGEGTPSISTIIIITLSLLLLLLLGAGFLLLWRRRRGVSAGGKVGVTEVFALEELQDPHRNSRLLSSLRRSRGQHRASCSSQPEEEDDGVFLMVYLPSPYEHALTRIARAASTGSSKDVEVGAEPGEGGGDEPKDTESGSSSRDGDGGK